MQGKDPRFVAAARLQGAASFRGILPERRLRSRSAENAEIGSSPGAQGTGPARRGASDRNILQMSRQGAKRSCPAREDLLC